MKTSQDQNQAVILFETIAQRLAERLPEKTKPFFLAMMLGALLAIARRRTVTKWLMAAQISDDYQKAFYHIPHIGRKGTALLDENLKMILEELGEVIQTAKSIRMVLDDSPTKRYGLKIEGAGYHHNPTPGRTKAKICFGHSWVVAALVITHPAFGEISFPIAAELYLRQKEIDKLKEKYDRKFQTKTTMVVEIVKRLVAKFKAFEKKIEVIVDGGYAADTVLVPLSELANVVVITRFRRDSAFYEIPVQPEKRGRGRPKVYGNKIDLVSMIESEDGWEYVECRQYGRDVTKRVKWFIVTSKLTRGKPIKVVLIKEDDGVWVPLVSTDISLEVREILESYAVRFGIEEMFKDLKEVWGWGKQELRLLESNEAATAMNMLLYSMTELATWNCDLVELVDRSDRPWDDPLRRPSHEDRRRYLRRGILDKEFNDALDLASIPQKITTLLKKLLQLAA